MKSILEVIHLAADYLRSKALFKDERGIIYRRDAEDLLAASLQIKRLDLYLAFDRLLEEKELENFREMIKRRAKGEPVAYIIGKVTFYNTELYVTPDVLIPRCETEILVDTLVSSLKKEDLMGRVLFDVCTGSGCIAIALKKRFPDLEVVAADICPKALAIAKKNALLNETPITFLEGDLLYPFANLQCDYFVANPPYISKVEMEHLDCQVKDFEPAKALFGGESGLEFYKKLSLDLKKYLTSSGKAWMEIGCNQSAAIREMFQKNNFASVSISKDYAGHDRFLFVQV